MDIHHYDLKCARITGKTGSKVISEGETWRWQRYNSNLNAMLDNYSQSLFIHDNFIKEL